MSAPVGTRAAYSSISEFHDHLVPEYKSAVYKPLLVTIQNWDWTLSERVWAISEKRAQRRISNYVSHDELSRAFSKLQSKDGASLRFGVEKLGHGYHGERGDFCLVGGYAEPKDLYLFWRSLELIGGFAYDVCLIQHVCDHLGVRPKRVHLHAMTANVFALRGNSNEKLFPKLKEAIHGN